MEKNDLSSMSCEQIQNIWASEPEVIGILDLRSKEEFESSHIPGSKNVKLADLRSEVLLLEEKLAVLICPESVRKTACDALAGKTNYVFMEGCERWLQTFATTRVGCTGSAVEGTICITTNQGIPEVSADEVHRTLGKLRLIDVRRPDEFNSELGHIEGAELVTLGPTLADFFGDSKNMDEQIVFICRSGKRSEAATKEALEAGFQKVANMVGGMLLWNEKKFPVKRS